jgi:hypothetical protein
MPLAPGTLFGRYRIESVLGRGGMATVYRASHVELDRPIALKVLDAGPGAPEPLMVRFQREGRLQASLRHPNILTVYEAGESDDGPFLAMRLVDGPTLAQLIEERVLGARRSLALLEQVADALDAAHAAGLVHRDVKPQNVLVAEDDHAYLGDFGLVRREAGGTRTSTGTLAGTVAYLAPEVVRGDEAGPAADRYAFAAMAFECLAGARVFPRPTDAAVLYAHASEPPPAIGRRRRELPAALDDLFAEALAKEPDARPASARAFTRAVRAVLEQAGALDLGPPPPLALDEPHDGGATADTIRPLRQPARRTRQRRWLPPAAAALAGAAAATLVALVVLDDEPSGTAEPVPGIAPGAIALGSDLARPGRPLDCRGAHRTRGDCSVRQSRLPGRQLVVPADGVIRRWAVRSGEGELALQALRPRSGEMFQIARSRPEFVQGDGVHVFDTDLLVERGDVLGVHAVDGARVGVRTGVGGAATERWVPRVGPARPPDLEEGSGFDHELLLRAELVPGAEPRVPRQLTGDRAASAPDGRLRARRSLRFTNGRPVTLELVRLDDRLVLDMVLAGRRAARIHVPDFRPEGGRLLKFEVLAEPSEPQGLGVFLQHVNGESTRIRQHYFVGNPGQFTFIN